MPKDYEKTTERYPVLYITDGDQHFFLAAGMTEFMSSQFIIPECIVVAIFHKDRNHDLTPTHCLTDYKGFKSDAVKVSGGGEKFLQFIENELIVQIDDKYRTTSYRILAGHSLGGLFCVYVYLSCKELFKGYISMDPVLNWDGHLCERLLKSLPDQSPNLTNKLYISSAHNAPEGKRDKGLLRMSQLSFNRELKTKNVINTRFELFEEENHLTVPYRSLYAGLFYIFSDYYIFNNPKFVEEISFIQDHYKKMSELYGMRFIPPEGLIEMLGKYFLQDMNEYTKSLEFFMLNTESYPESCKAYENLAKAYKALGDIDNALLNFKKSLELDPDNSEIKKSLIELEAR
jgi:predicted alpha/beta superfamily hydrolase